MAKVYTRDMLLDPQWFSMAFQNMDNKYNSQKENRSKMAEMFKSMVSGASEIGKTGMDQWEQSRRFNSLQDANADYVNDPMYQAAKEEYARTGNSGALNSFKTNWTAMKKAEADKALAELTKKKNAKDAYDVSKIDRDTAAQEIDLLMKDNNKDANEKARLLTGLQAKFNKNDKAMKSYAEDAGIEYDEYIQPIANVATEWGSPEQPTASPVAKTEVPIQSVDNSVPALLDRVQRAQSEGSLEELNKIAAKLETLGDGYGDVHDAIKKARTEINDKEVKSLWSAMKSFKEAPKNTRYNYSKADIEKFKTALEKIPEENTDKNELNKLLKELEKYTKENKPKFSIDKADPYDDEDVKKAKALGYIPVVRGKEIKWERENKK